MDEITRRGPAPGRLAAALTALLLTTGAAAPAAASAFAVSEQGARAMGMGGAFTAVADDPTAIFDNVGGLGLLGKGGVAVGATALARSQTRFQGRAPGLAQGTLGEMTDVISLPVHAYAVKALSPTLKVGLGVYQPFELATDWGTGKDTFAGRGVSLRSEIDAYDVNPSAGLALSPRLGIGVGVIFRFSQVSMLRRYQAANPLPPLPGDDTPRILDIASLEAETDTETGVGWTAGVLWRPTRWLSLGVSYRSGIDFDYAGSGTLSQLATGNDQLDDLFAAILPFDTALAFESRLEFPEVLSYGVAFGASENFLVALDFDQVGWSKVQQLAFAYPNDPFAADPTFRPLSTTVPLRFDDTTDWRLGFEWTTLGGTSFRLGYADEESPQALEAVGPFLADADRSVISVGIGRDWLDVGLEYIRLDDRTTTSNLNLDPLTGREINGRYSTDFWALGITVSK